MDVVVGVGVCWCCSWTVDLPLDVNILINKSPYYSRILRVA
jgi:hypothetical protein